MAPTTGFPHFAPFLADVAAITAHLVGADRVHLRSFTRLPEAGENVSGAAYLRRGHLEIGHDVPPLVDALLSLGRPALTAVRLDRLREVLGTLLHECIHLALPDDDPRLARRGGLGRRLVPRTSSVVFLEEGVTESATQTRLPRLLARLEGVFPGVSLEVPDRSWHYPNYVPATRELLALISTLPDMRGRDALLELARVGPERKFDLLVEQAMEGFGLTYNVPARDRDQVRTRIRTALEGHVRRNHGWMVPPDPHTPGRLNTHEPHALSTIMGKQMGMELLRQLYTEGEAAGMELPEGWPEILADKERDLAQRLVQESAFSGPESQAALDSWIEATAVRFGDPASTLAVPADRWLRRVRPHRRRGPEIRRELSGRGMKR